MSLRDHLGRSRGRNRAPSFRRSNTGLPFRPARPSAEPFPLHSQSPAALPRQDSREDIRPGGYGAARGDPAEAVRADRVPRGAGRDRYPDEDGGSACGGRHARLPRRNRWRPARQPWRLRPVRLSLLRQTDFRWFFTGQLVSLLGTSMAPVALAFAVLNASGSTGDLGIVLAAHMVPLLAFLLVGGATADRFGRRTVLVAANLGSALTQGGVAALLLTGHYSLPLVAALEFLNGVLAAFTTPALRGIVPQLVDRDRLQQANALLGSMRNATKIFGPSLSGVLVVVVGSGPAIAFDAVTYLVAAGCLTRLSPVGRVDAPRKTTMAADIRDGWTEFRRIRWVWVVSLTFCLINMVQTGTWQILGPELTRELSGEATWGFVLSARGLGLLVMSSLMYRLVVRHLLRLGQLMSALGALPLLVLGAHLHSPWLIAGAFVAGLGSAVAAVGWDTSLQEHVPPHALSRVSSYDDLLSYVAIPIGQLCVGPLAHRFGGFRVTTTAGLVYLVAAVAPLLSGTVRRLPHAPAGHRAPVPAGPAADAAVRPGTPQQPAG
ncbi:MFS transporter [Kitasatospora cystarginea]|uniref:MFS transporter n=1 Tax=Kitasatospora cystarginea TaxID=58350 RepID=UPI0031E47665